MAEYDDLDDDALQKMLSDASSYEERATIRQVLRKRKKEKGEATAHSKPKGRSVYNRFAGSTATKSSARSAGIGVVQAVPPSNQPKQDLASPARKASPVQKPSTPPMQPVTTPTPPPTPEPAKSPDEVDGIPVTTEPAEDKESDDEEAQEITRDQPDLGIQEEPAQPEPEEPEPEPEPEEPAEPEPKSPEPKSPDPKKPDPRDAEQPDGPVVARRPPRSTFEPTKEPLPAGTNLHKYLVAYVNQELFLDPPLPNRGKALFDTCSDPTSLCKLINKCAPGTVDMRALSKITGSSSQRAEALHDNLTLAIESGRAIGCQVDDSTTENILRKDPETINKFLLDLVRARVVHMPGMDDEPSSTFTDLDTLFQKLHISVDEPVSWRDDPDKVRKALKTSPPPAKQGSWRDTDLTYDERAALRKAEREQRQKEKEAKDNSVGLTYEERASQRKAERECRRKEREALAK